MKNKISRQFKLISAAVLIVLSTLNLAGCVTLYALDSIGKRQNYSETVKSVYISEDKNNLVVISTDFHYVFKTTPDVLVALDDRVHKKISAMFSPLYVDGNNDTSIQYTLKLTPDHTPAQLDIALNSGFKKYRGIDVSSEGEMKGVRYRSGGLQIPADATRLNNTYDIHVIQSTSKAANTAKILLSPITLAADGVLIIGFVALTPIIYPFAKLLNSRRKT